MDTQSLLVNNIKQFDPDIAEAIAKEELRQKEKLELIASENYVSNNVLAASGSVFTNKYAEGYVNKRYYGGCENVDTIETLAINRAKKLFGVEAANVQAHSGAQANMAAYLALINPGDKILGLDLSHGGHLTHGAPVNFSGMLFETSFYKVNDQGYLDYDQIRDIALKEKPQLIIAGFSAYPRKLDFAKFRDIANEVDAWLIADIAHVAGLVASGCYPSPVEYCDLVTTTTHKTLRGPRGGMILGSADLIKKVDSKVFPGMQGGPLCHTICAKAVAFKEALQESFIDYSKKVVLNAQKLAEILVDKGYNLLTGGTDNHLLLIDLRNKNITGKLAEKTLDKAYITVNKNTVPNETASPFVTSGIRLGTAALTTRGMETKDLEQVAYFIDLALQHHDDQQKIVQIGHQVKEFAIQFPIFKS